MFGNFGKRGRFFVVIAVVAVGVVGRGRRGCLERDEMTGACFEGWMGLHCIECGWIGVVAFAGACR